MRGLKGASCSRGGTTGAAACGQEVGSTYNLIKVGKLQVWMRRIMPGDYIGRSHWASIQFYHHPFQVKFTAQQVELWRCSCSQEAVSV